MNPESLPHWWGPDGFSCRTKRIDLRTGGDWVFDMIAPDGTVFPNHHRYGEVRDEYRIGYALLWGENGPKHADAWAQFEDADGATKVTLAWSSARSPSSKAPRASARWSWASRPLASWRVSSGPNETGTAADPHRNCGSCRITFLQQP